MARRWMPRKTIKDRPVGLQSAVWEPQCSAPVLRRIGPRHVPRIAGPLGFVLQAAGLSIRVWSMKSLAESYSRTLRVTNGQTVNESGPYRFVRHPGYLGSLLIWAGFSLTSASVPVVGLVAGLLIPAYRQRILAEESPAPARPCWLRRLCRQGEDARPRHLVSWKVRISRRPHDASAKTGRRDLSR